MLTNKLMAIVFWVDCDPKKIDTPHERDTVHGLRAGLMNPSPKTEKSLEGTYLFVHLNVEAVRHLIVLQSKQERHLVQYTVTTRKSYSS